MVQKIQQANAFGRLGESIGGALADQVPREIERHRLASGLSSFEKESGNLSPVQQVARLSSIPGITPQMIQSITEAAKIQNQGNAYKRGASNNQNRDQRDTPPPRSSADLRDVKFANILDNASKTQNMPPQGDVNNQQRTPNMPVNQDVPQVSQGNALNEQNLARLPWTPQQRQSTVSNYIDQGFLPEQARQLQQDDESRDLAEPGAHKQRLEDIDNAKAKVRETLKRHLETKLHKNDKEVFKDVEGRMLLNAERGMTRDLIKNPNADIDNVANDWSERLYNTAIAKDKMRTLGKTTGFENFLKGDSSEKKLKEYQDIFKRSGNLDEFKNMLQGPDFGMSAQAAASVAYPPNPKISKILSSYRSPSTPHYNPTNKMQEARKLAIQIENEIGPDDSILSIVRKLSEKDPYFDQQAFIDQISDDKNDIGLNERQRLELAEGPQNILPNWADILYLPFFRRS